MSVAHPVEVFRRQTNTSLELKGRLGLETEYRNQKHVMLVEAKVLGEIIQGEDTD